MKVKATMDSANCKMFVEGMDMSCPLCGILVRSGNKHECTNAPAQRTPAKKAKA